MTESFEIVCASDPRAPWLAALCARYDELAERVWGHLRGGHECAASPAERRELKRLIDEYTCATCGMFPEDDGSCGECGARLVVLADERIPTPSEARAER